MTDSATPPTDSAPTDDQARFVPRHLRFGTDAFMGPTMDVRLRGPRLVFRRSPGGYRPDLVGTWEVTPTLGQWREFREQLDAIGVWSWKKNYCDVPVCDGMSWHLDIRYADRRRSSGGLSHAPEEFERFERALARLLGVPELFGEAFADAGDAQGQNMSQNMSQDMSQNMSRDEHQGGNRDEHEAAGPAPNQDEREDEDGGT